MKKLLIVFTALLVLPCMAFAIPVPDTGQTKCYGNTQEIPCPQPGQPFYGQDAQYGSNTKFYTKLNANGDDLPFSATEWAIVRDDVTGLIWEVKHPADSIQDYNNPHDADNEYYWSDSLGDGTGTEDFINALNTPPGFGSFTDWRMPTAKELPFLLNSDIGPAIDQSYFPNTAPLYVFWSSTTDARFTDSAWRVYISIRRVQSREKFDDHYVRAVRGGQFPNNFIDNGDGTVTDTATGLMWQQATAPEAKTWKEALTYCEGLSLAGHDDWRLPNRNELQSIVDYSTHYPAIDTTYFPDTKSSDYCSSTTKVQTAHNSENAWYVNFNSGSVNSDDKTDNFYIRAVRGGLLEPTTSSSSSSSTTTIVFQDCMLNISILPPEGGTTSPPPPQYFIMGCLPVTIEALPNSGYTFSHWEGDAQGSDNPVMLEGGGNRSIIAVFTSESTANIPTLSEWGIIIFMTLIMGIGIVILVRRRMV